MRSDSRLISRFLTFLLSPYSIVTLLMVLIIFLQWLMPGSKVGGDFPFISSDALKSLFDLPRVWTDNNAVGLGEYTVFTLWSWPLSLILGMLSSLGLTFSILERLIFVLPTLLIGGFGIWYLLEQLDISPKSEIIGIFLYIANTYLLLLIDGGQLSIALAYAWFPVVYLLVSRAAKVGIVPKLFAGVGVAILGFLDIRFIFILFILSLLTFFHELVFLDGKEFTEWLFQWVKSAIIIFLIYGGLNAYWILPIIRVPLSSSVFAALTHTSGADLINLGHPLLLLAPNWYKNIFGQVAGLQWQFLFIPLLAFLAPVLRRRDKRIAFWLIVALVSIFLTKGTSWPFAQIFPWLFSHIPGFSLFRDSTKFFVLVALSYSILVAISIEEISERLNKKRILRIAMPLVVIAYFFALVWPVWLGQMTGTFSIPRFESGYSVLHSSLGSDKSYVRILWIPSVPPSGYFSPDHPALEGLRLIESRPFAVGIKGTYETMNFLREASYSGQLLDVAGVGYIADPPLDPRRDNMKPDNVNYYYTFLNQLENRNWVSSDKLDSGIPLIKTRSHQDKIFVTKNLWWVIGSDTLYNESTKSANLTLSKNALVFAEEYPGLSNRLDEYPQAKIVLNNKTLMDLAANFISENDLIFPAKNLDFSPNQTGWWKRETADLISWKDFLLTKYGIRNQDFDLGGGWAVGEGNKKLTINMPAAHSGDVLLARVLESTRSGTLQFSQGSKVIGTLQTQKSGDNVRWFQVGNLKSNSTSLTIHSQGEINVVNALAVLSRAKWQEYQSKANVLSPKVEEYNEQNAGNLILPPNLTFQQVNPTEYKVDITGIKEPTFMVLSQNYNDLWKLGGQDSLPVYSLLNGFEVTKDGEYTIYFEPQKYVYPGLVISGVTVLLLVGLLVFLKKKSTSISA